MPDFNTNIKERAVDLGWKTKFVKLPTDLVVHTGVAICQMLFALDAGMFPRAERVHTVVSEVNLRSWPKSSGSVHRQRLDNINSSLRAFGVDGQSTRLVNKGANTGEFLLRSMLGSFVFIGDGLMGDLDADLYRKRLTKLKKRALTDENFAEEMVFAALYGPERAPNGMRLQKQAGLSKLMEHMVEVSGNGSNVTLVVLAPDGDPLTVQ